ncbi:MAG: cobalamin biosynthesis protein [Treponema sp.]|jgi:cobalt-precorrin 5A hydrolase|nr:cobalamin biosynthesis protein [Treponema sp.]
MNASLPSPIALIAVSAKGAVLAEGLGTMLPGAEVCVLEKYVQEGQRPFTHTGSLAATLWKTHKGMVFLCASSIAIRAIAPLVLSKYTDPAVVITGDSGAFSISLLSGHEGGANRLAEKIAACINNITVDGKAQGSVPVITTASESSLPLLPRNLFAGIGCKRGMETTAIIHVIQKTCAEYKLSPLRIRAICTIDMKRHEPGLAEAAEAFGFPLLFFSAEALNTAAGDFSSSDYVRQITGTDNVCERAAALGGETGRIIVPKTAHSGVTFAVFEKDVSPHIQNHYGGACV